MQLAAVILLMGVLPVASILIEHFYLASGATLVFLIGKWFVFWAVGWRLLLAGVKQITDPTFTAETIFRITDKSAQKIVAELGFGNVAIGTLGVLSIFNSTWVTPAAIAGFLFFGLAGGKHVFNQNRTAPENVALYSDLFIALVLVGYLTSVWLGS